MSEAAAPRDPSAPCACGSGSPRSECCGPQLDRRREAETAEQLMRARYSAFAEGDLDFIRDTLTARGREDHDEAGTRDWALHSKWHGLEVVSSSAGGKDDDEGEVEFVASYSQRGKRVDHHERALFVREDGKWRFSDSKGVAMGTIKRDEPKVGRNEPCRCGSGKKAKKCCGAI